MRIGIDGQRCQGHGRCYELAPDLVEDDERSRGQVTQPDVGPQLQDQARAAARACPEQAVVLTE